jgi:hypothetical protein
MHPLADFLADCLGFGRDFEIDRHRWFPRFLFLLVGLEEWHKPAVCQRQRKQSLKQQGRKERPCPILPICFPDTPRMDQHLVGPHLCPRRRQGPPLLLLHGFSSTHVMWHPVAPQLADRFTLIIADLPGYGWSDMPAATTTTRPTPSAMAKVMVEAMEQLGHVHFALAGHDRGGRVSYRLALDHPAGCRNSRCSISRRPMTTGRS